MASSSKEQKPIVFYNRYTQQLETEEIYGEGFLRWAYESFPGRSTINLLAKRSFFSRWYGWRMDRPRSKKKILPFIEKYCVPSNEFKLSPDAFRSFNDFFIRKLKPEARPIDQNPNTIAFPADGRHLGIQNIAKAAGFFVKGEKFSLANLLQNDALAQKYAQGAMIISRLCPTDYHRFHFPCTGVPSEATCLNGFLYSVNPVALRRNIHYLTQNKRFLTSIQTEELGNVLSIEVGATCVGSVQQTYTPHQPIQKGEEKGFFEFGGSTVITLFEPNRVQLDPDLYEQGVQNRELYARMGDNLGKIRK